MISIYSSKKKSIKNDGIYITAEFRGLSTDTKGTIYKDENNNEFIIDNGSLFVEIDTGDVYLYDIINQDWELQTGGGGGSNLQNKSVTVTSNGSQDITADSGYDGLSKVALTTNVQPTLQTKSVTISSNGSTTVTKDSGYDGMTEVNITTNVSPNNQTKNITITENTTTTVTPDANYDGLSQVEITTNVSGGADLSEYFLSTVTPSTSSESIARKIIKKLPPFYITSLRYTFYSMINLIEIDVSGFTYNNYSDMTGFCFQCQQLKTIKNLEMLNTSNVTNMTTAFRECYLLDNPNFSNFNTSNVTNMSQMFSGFSYQQLDNLKTLNLSSFDFSKVNNITNMFNLNTYLGTLIFGTNLGKGYTQQTANYNNYKLDLSSAINLTHDSLMSVINNLYDLNLTYDVAGGGTLYTQSLVLGSTNLAKLTSAEIQIATDKGWNVS